MEKISISFCFPSHLCSSPHVFLQTQPLRWSDLISRVTDAKAERQERCVGRAQSSQNISVLGVQPQLPGLQRPGGTSALPAGLPASLRVTARVHRAQRGASAANLSQEFPWCPGYRQFSGPMQSCSQLHNPF